MEYEVRPYHQGDEEQIVILLQLVFDGWRDLDFWSWKYLDNPLKMKDISVAVSDGGVIGFSGSIYKKVKVGDKVILSSCGTDAGVHPDFRRMGVHSKNTKLKIELGRRVSKHISYWCTENPILIQHRSGYSENPRYQLPYLRYFFRIRDMDLHNRMNPPTSLSARLRRRGHHAIKIFNDTRNTLSTQPKNENIRVSEIHEFDERVDTFWDEIKDHYDFIIERSRDHLNWNYCDPRGGNHKVKLAEEEGRILGYTVLRIHGDGKYLRGEVVDLLTIPGRSDVVDALLADANRFFDDNDVNLVTSLVVEGHPYAKLYKRHGFIDVRRKIHVFYTCPREEEEFSRLVRNALEAIDAKRMHLSRGDII